MKDNNILTKKTILFGLLSATLLGFAMMMVPISTSQKAFASGAANTLDPNGLLRKDPVAGYTMSFGGEYYIQNAVKNFRSDGSERIDFRNKETDSLLIAGYFNVVLGDANNANWCNENAGNPGEEISTKINGGPHTNNGDEGDPNVFGDGSLTEPNAEWADTADFGVINAEGDNSRLRFEYPRHPDYQPETAPFSQPGLPLTAADICSVPGGWIGIMTEKFNLDNNCDGVVDRIQVYNFVDESGLHPTTGAPQNNWELVWYKQFGMGSWLTAGKSQSYVENIGQPSYRYQTIRIDDQDQASWLDNADPPYKFVTLKQITNILKDGCTTPVQAMSVEEEAILMEQGLVEEGPTPETARAVETNEDNDQVTQSNNEEEELTQTEQEEEEERPSESDNQNPKIQEDGEGSNDDE